MAKIHYIERPPRLLPDMPHEEIEIPVPPQQEQDVSQPLIQVLLPLLTILAFFAVALLGRGGNLLFMLPMAISVIASISLALYNRSRSAEKKRVKQATYRNRLLELRKEMATSHEIQRRNYLHNYPDPITSLQIGREAHHIATQSADSSRLGTRLWERRPDDPDFGTLRLGIGTLPSTVVYTVAQSNSSDDRQMRDALRLSEDSRTVTGVPINISLRNPQPEIGQTPEAGLARHAIGIVGANPRETYEFISALLVNYTTYHSPTEANLYVLGLQEAWNNWRWLGRMPHCASDRPNEMLSFEDEKDRKNGRERNKVSQFLRNLGGILDERLLRLRDSDSGADVTLPFMLVVVDLLAAIPDDSMLADLEMEPAFSLLLEKGHALGAAVIFLVPELGVVPSGCQSVIELIATSPNQQKGEVNSTTFRYAEVGLNSKRYAGTADRVSSLESLFQYSQHLESLKVRRSYGADLPPSLLMLDMLKVKSIVELRSKTLANWQASRQPDQADWLKVAIGALSGGDVRRLKLSADADGVHGLIAGSTGSGKSELLMTMILSLAYAYDPSIVNFVLVDFKGGAAFEPFRNLPHVVDIVTNLKGSAVERMFAAIMAEIHRREALNVATDSKHIVHYRKNNLHGLPYGTSVTIKGETHKTAPYPHLFVIIDEFAEMIAENPEYKAQLNSITRLGRALGITLILAAQRPTGVTDQMRANIKFRIALRVETREESSEVLRRPDAAYLPTGIPGRGYLQVGNENIELIQIAWTGSDYRGDVKEEKPRVIWHGRPRKKRAFGEIDEYPKVYEVMVAMMAELAREHSLPQRKPWPGFLPTQLTLQTPLDATYLDPESLNFLLGEVDGGRRSEASITGEYGSDPTGTVSVVLNHDIGRWIAGERSWRAPDWNNRAMRAAVGLVDDPDHSEQLPLVVDFRRGHAAIFGAPGWGKTTFLRTLIASLAATHSPQDLHIYIMDFGGRQLNVFRELPHVGAVISPDEDERVVRLLRRLDEVLQSRKALISDAGADDLYSYNALHPDQPMPAILVVIDNFAEFRESYENLLPALISLGRESRANGIHFALSAGTSGALTGKLFSLFTERYALKLADPTEYTSIVGRGAQPIDDIAGRGYVKIGRKALEFQVALPAGSAGEAANLEETQKLTLLVRAFGESDSPQAKERLPFAVDILTSRVLLKNLLATAQNGLGGGHIRPVYGIEDLTLQPWAFDIPRLGPHCLFIGSPNSGKTTALRSLILSLAATYSPDEVMIVIGDMQRRISTYGGDFTLADLPHVVGMFENMAEIVTFVDNLKEEFAHRAALDRRKRRSVVIVIDNYDSFLEEAGRSQRVLADLAVLAREYGTSGLHFVLAGSPNITRSVDELRKQVQLSRFGIALQSAEMVQVLNGRVSRSLAQAELPLGRGFVVRSGRTFMLQIATPYEDEENQEDILDNWIETVQTRYPGQKAVWKSNGAGGEVDGRAPHPAPPLSSTPGTPASAAIPITPTTVEPAKTDPSPAVRLRAVPEHINVESIKEQLKLKGFNEKLMRHLSPVDIVNVALEMKIVSEADLMNEASDE